MNEQFSLSRPLDRSSGVLLHLTSLPSPYGIGDMGPAAYRFVEFLQKAGQKLWQVLPLTPAGAGNSPYTSYSAFACNPLLICPEYLRDQRLLAPEDVTNYETFPTACPVDFEKVIPRKYKLYKKAFYAFQSNANPELYKEFPNFRKEQQSWLADYALFMACADENGSFSWLKWPEPYRNPDNRQKTWLREQLAEPILFYEFLQYILFREWQELRTYANERGIHIIGDIPVFVAMESADIWSRPDLFQLDVDGCPTAIAGVPPDYFSSDGQLWGNPLYNWEMHEKEDFTWWTSRIEHQLQLFDCIRIDHFRGFESYWSTPYGEKTAINGCWKPGPGRALFDKTAQKLGNQLPIIAEDLGIITSEVEALRDELGFPGMKVLEFAFDGADSTYLPHRYQHPNCVCYTGTHDNDTIVGWFAHTSEETRKKVLNYMHTDGEQIHMDFIRTAMSTIANYAIFPLQDLLGLGSEHRMNLPGTSGGQNWRWRFDNHLLTDELAKELKAMTRLYGR